MAAGLPAGTVIIRVLEVKSIGSAALSSLSTSLSMFAVSAEANTSAGAPSWIWVTRPEEPVKLKSTDRKSTRLNSSHVAISYAVFCLKKKNVNRGEVECKNKIKQ